MWNNNNVYYGGSPNPPAGSGFIMPSTDPYARRSGATPEPLSIPPRPSDRGAFDVPGEDYRTRGGHYHHHRLHQSGTPGFVGNFPGAGGFAPPGRTSPYNAPAGPPSGVYSPPGGPPNMNYGYPSPPGPPPRAQYNSAHNAPAGPLPGVHSPPVGPPPSMNYGYSSPPGPPPRSQYNGGYGNERQDQWQESNYRPDFEYVQPGEPIAAPTSMQYYEPQSGGGQGQPTFAYSQCNGKKKALIIGINYIRSDRPLEGCINDARNMKKFIKEIWNYQEEDTVVLTDDALIPEEQPTRANTIRAMAWLVRDAAPNDSLFFHYSGHGGLTKDLDGDKPSGYGVVIYPIDFESAGHIVDDDMHEIMVRKLPTGCRLTAIYDSCHSGTALNLPYVYSTEGKIKEYNPLAEAGKSALSAGIAVLRAGTTAVLSAGTAVVNAGTAVIAYARRDDPRMLQGFMGLADVHMGTGRKAVEYSRRTKSSSADVISWSACKDSQTGADVSVNGQGTGAMSWAFTTSLRDNPRQSYQQLLVSIRSILREKLEQKPQLSSSHPIDTNILFIA